MCACLSSGISRLREAFNRAFIFLPSSSLFPPPPSPPCPPCHVETNYIHPRLVLSCPAFPACLLQELRVDERVYEGLACTARSFWLVQVERAAVLPWYAPIKQIRHWRPFAHCKWLYTSVCRCAPDHCHISSHLIIPSHHIPSNLIALHIYTLQGSQSRCALLLPADMPTVKHFLILFYKLVSSDFLVHYKLIVHYKIVPKDYSDF